MREACGNYFGECHGKNSKPRFAKPCQEEMLRTAWLPETRTLAYLRSGAGQGQTSSKPTEARKHSASGF